MAPGNLPDADVDVDVGCRPPETLTCARGAVQYCSLFQNAFQLYLTRFRQNRV